MGVAREDGWFTAADGRPIYYRAHLPAAPRAVILVVHGLHEHSGRYVHVLDHLAQRGFAGFAQDHRGHGRSARTLGDLESLDAILADLAVLHRDATTRYPGLPVFLLGHSMGGLIGALYAQHTPLAGVVLNAAAVALPDDVPAAVVRVAGLLARLAPRLPVQPFFRPLELSHDPQVLADVQADPLFYKGRLRARTGHQIAHNVGRALAGLPRLTAPLLVTHGTADRTVPLRASELLFGGAASADKTLRLFEGMLHECHNELARAEVLDAWTSWLEARL